MESNINHGSFYTYKTTVNFLSQKRKENIWIKLQLFDISFNTLEVKPNFLFSLYEEKNYFYFVVFQLYIEEHSCGIHLHISKQMLVALNKLCFSWSKIFQQRTKVVVLIFEKGMCPWNVFFIEKQKDVNIYQ